MKENGYAKMPTEKLKKLTTTVSAISGILGGTLLVLFAIKFYDFVENDGSGASLITPIALLPVLFLNLLNLKNMKAELKNRNR
jgi:hypothetical protein